MNTNELYSKIRSKDYDTKLPYPPFRTNMEERIKLAAQDRDAKESYRKDNDRLEKTFRSDLKEYVDGVLDTKLTAKQFTAIYSTAYEKGHSCGYSEILSETMDLIDVISNFITETK